MIKWKKKDVWSEKNNIPQIEGQGPVERKKNVSEWKNKC